MLKDPGKYGVREAAESGSLSRENVKRSFVTNPTQILGGIVMYAGLLALLFTLRFSFCVHFRLLLSPCRHSSVRAQEPPARAPFAIGGNNSRTICMELIQEADKKDKAAAKKMYGYENVLCSDASRHMACSVFCFPEADDPA